MFRIVGLVAIPLQVLTVYWLIAFLPDQLWDVPDPRLFGPQPTPPEVDPDDLIGFGVFAIVVVFATFVATQISIGACYREIVGFLVGAESDWRASLRFLNRNGPRLVWLAFLLVVLELIGFAACIIPGIFVFVYWSVAMPVLLSEKRRGRRALGRSYRLIYKRWWRTFAVILIVFMLVSIVGQFIGAPNVYLVLFPESKWLLALGLSLGSALSLILFTPLYSAVATALYVDARRAVGELDLDALAAGVDLVPAADRPPLLPESRPTQADSPAPPYWPPPPGWPHAQDDVPK